MSNCMKAIGALLSCAMVMLAAHPALAGTVRPSSHPGCDYEFRVLITDGVAAGLAPIGRSYDGVTLCLDSPGGSLPEGMAMFEAIRDMNIMTRVPAGWRCESACALAFMAGSITTGLGVPVTIGAHRLDAGGRLGFHAPSLELSENSLHSSEDVAAAFDTALQASALLYRASLQEADDWRSFNEYLYSRILETPPGSMYRIDTIGDAILSGIRLGPVRMPDRITEREIAHLCDAAYLTEKAALEIRVPDGAAEIAWQRLRGEHAHPERREWMRDLRLVSLQRQGDRLIGQVGGYAPERFYATGCRVEIESAALARNGGARVAFYLYEVYDEDDRRADGSARLATSWQPDPEDLLTEAHVPLWFLHDPATPLASLATGIDALQAHPGATHVVNTRAGGRVNLRAGPGTGHAVLREVAHGRGVAWLMDNGDGWAEVALDDGTTGWISARLLTPI